MTTRKHWILTTSTATLLFTLLAAGCSHQSAEGDTSPELHVVKTSVTDTASKYLLTEEPDDAIGVITTRKEAKDGDEIVLLGRIGGSKNPWIDGRSAFMLIDASMLIVGDGQESEEGELCLDDCCASLRAECTTLVKLVDDQGRVLSVDARQLLGINVDDLVVVRGHVERDEQEGSFVVIADGVHVRR